MNYRLIGLVILVLSAGLFYSVYTSTMNTLALNTELHKSCPLPEAVCPFRRSISTESALGFAVDGGLVILGLYLFLFSKEPAKHITVQTKQIKSTIKSLDSDEQKVYKTLVNSEGFVFQNELIEKTGLNKVKVTRVLDKLEGKSLVERRRRGMSNVVVLKHG